LSRGNRIKGGGGVYPDQVRDYRLLMQRWLDLVNGIPSLDLVLYGEADGYPLLALESRQRKEGVPSVYFSAGIHGDEPAGVEGLCRWAEGELARLSHWNWQIFPCLNPWGLERNVRFDAVGRDLNRCFNARKVPRIAAQLALMKGWHYDLAVALHEDYDSRGFYLYEIAARRPHWGESLCKNLTPLLPADPRTKIDGHPARHGLIRRRVSPGMMKGHPEAFLLHFKYAARTFTLETPSEESLERRTSAQTAFLRDALKKLESQNGIFARNC